MKNYIKADRQYRSQVLQSESLKERYAEAQRKKATPEGKKAKEDRDKLKQALSIPKRQFRGCVATKLKPDDYETTIRDLPLGIRRFMKANPQQYESYLKEIRAEAKYLRAIKENVSNRPHDKRREAYEELVGRMNPRVEEVGSEESS